MPGRAAAFVSFMLLCSPALADWESSLLPRGFDHASSLERAVALAKEKDKAVILYYTRTNCPPCSALQGRLRKDEVGAPYRANYVFTAAWGTAMNRAEREAYRERYGVQAAPTWVVFDSSGKYVCTSDGGFRSDEAGAKLHAAIQAQLAKAPPDGSAPRRCVARHAE